MSQIVSPTIVICERNRFLAESLCNAFHQSGVFQCVTCVDSDESLLELVTKSAASAVVIDPAMMAALSVGWNDVGAWSAMHTIGTKTEGGNVLDAEVLCIDTHNSLVRGCGRLIAVIGMDDVIIVDTPDALLVTNHKNAQRVKDAVTALKHDGRMEVQCHRLPHDPEHMDGVDRVFILPGKAAEPTGAVPAGSVMTVTAGRATIRVDGQSLEARAGDTLLVRSGVTARIVNNGDGPLTLVAVTIGETFAGAGHEGLFALDGERARAGGTRAGDRRVA